MSEETEVSSVDTGESTVTDQTDSQSDSTPEATSTEPEVETKQEDKPVPAEPPFHEHPRFKELIEQNRAYRESESLRTQALESMQRELASLRELTKPKTEQPKDPFLADLEKVNPAYAKSLQAIYDKAGKAEAIEQRLQQYEAQQFAEKAVSHFNNLLESSKISDPWDRKIYERAVRAEVYERESRGEKLGIKDLDKIFSTFHNEYSKSMEERNRKLTASYVQEKAKDKTPRSTTGLPAAPAGKKLAASDFSGQAKWLADQIRSMKKEH